MQYEPEFFRNVLSTHCADIFEKYEAEAAALETKRIFPRETARFAGEAAAVLGGAAAALGAGVATHIALRGRPGSQKAATAVTMAVGRFLIRNVTFQGVKGLGEWAKELGSSALNVDEKRWEAPVRLRLGPPRCAVALTMNDHFDSGQAPAGTCGHDRQTAAARCAEVRSRW
jgi:hypothetical protein